ncbi:MAG: TonB-dependent receptor, partial [bacterium]
IPQIILIFSEKYINKPIFLSVGEGICSMLTFKVRIYFCFVLLTSILQGSDQSFKGMIKGQVRDQETKAPLISANIQVMNTDLGTASDDEGNFEIRNVPVGTHSLKVSYIGYTAVIETDVVVKSQRTTFITVELQSSPLRTETIVVNARYFSNVEDKAATVINFSNEEIRRAPGTAGDVSRIIMSLPSTTKTDDQSNNLIVRGGNPIENAFYIDNIEIPNINHWPTQGSSGGYIGLLNIDLIQDVSFYSGGFPVIYGNKLSSIMNINFREGNKKEYEAQLNLNIAGFGGVAEGPFIKDNSSWLISARRSYLDLLVKYVDLGNSITPRYGDIQGKLVWDLSPDHFENTTGINWRALWDERGYSNTSFAFTSTKFKEDFFETGSNNQLLKNRSQEKTFKLRNINHIILTKKISLNIGLDAKYYQMKYDNMYHENTDLMGQTVDDIQLKKQISAYSFRPFLNLSLRLLHRFTTIIGVGIDYLSFRQNYSISSRFAVNYQLTTSTALKGVIGLYIF